MTNSERYQRACSVLHASESCLMEVKAMNSKAKRYMPRLVAVCAAVVLLLALASVAYATDLGGIQRRIQIWINGDQTDAVLDIQGGRNAEYAVSDEQGNILFGGGGVVINEFGRERPLTEDEIIEHLENIQKVEVEYREDGTVWVSYRVSKTESIYIVTDDITELFDENGVCYVQLDTDDGPLYLTVKYQAGFATSPHRFVDPDSFGTE